MRFKNQAVIITGASSGIGRAAALAFAGEGANVCIADIDKVSGDRVGQEIEKLGTEALVLGVDIAKEEKVQGLMDTVINHWHRLDILVNNAGIYYQANAIDMELEKWNNLLAVNLTGAFLCTKHAARAMLRGPGGVIVNVASEAALVAIPDQVAYNVSKAGLVALTKSCAVDLTLKGVRVNCVCPGTTDTPLVEAAVNKAPDPAAARRALEASRPINRLGKPEEIASAILYLASREAGYATGSILSIDGGYTSQ